MPSLEGTLFDMHMYIHICTSCGAGLLYHVTFHIWGLHLYLMYRRKEDESKQSKHHDIAKQSNRSSNYVTKITFLLRKIRGFVCSSSGGRSVLVVKGWQAARRKSCCFQNFN